MHISRFDKYIPESFLYSCSFRLLITSVGSLNCTHLCRKSFCRKKYYYCEITIVCQVPSRLRYDILLIQFCVLHICVLIVFQLIIKLSIREASSTVEKDESMPFHSKMNSSAPRTILLLFGWDDPLDYLPMTLLGSQRFHRYSLIHLVEEFFVDNFAC